MRTVPALFTLSLRCLAIYYKHLIKLQGVSHRWKKTVISVLEVSSVWSSAESCFDD